MDTYGQSYYEPEAGRTLNQALLRSTLSGEMEELLRFADRNSMAHGRELRLPFLQHELLAFLFRLPPSLKIKNGWTKWLLRQAMKDKLPGEITWRKEKVGYEPPQKTWMRDSGLQDMLQQAMHTLEAERILGPGKSASRPPLLDAHAGDNFGWRYLVAGSLL
jgi:asparagine synthase (glutamine-hydrolysing)